jgi:hypothetical protein
MINSVDDIEEHVASYAVRHLWRDEQRQQLVDLIILQNHPIDMLPMPGELSMNDEYQEVDSIHPSIMERDTLEMLCNGWTS